MHSFILNPLKRKRKDQRACVIWYPHGLKTVDCKGEVTSETNPNKNRDSQTYSKDRYDSKEKRNIHHYQKS